MTTTFFSLEQFTSLYNVEQDWLFEKLLARLEVNRHLVLAADDGWGVMEYVKELGFQLSEKNPDIHICEVDVRQTPTPDSFLNLFSTTLAKRFPEVFSQIEMDFSRLEVLKLPALIAKKKKIRIAIFLANSHLLHRYRNQNSFLRTLKQILKTQENSVYCLYGNNNQNFRDLIQYPGPLSGLGHLVELNHNPLNHRSASVRKLFHDHEKKISYITSVQMSHRVNNHPFYLKLLAWHAFIRTRHTCTTGILELAFNDLIHHFDYHFHKIAESLTIKQLRFLEALLEGNQKFYTTAIREEYQLGSSSNISRIKESLGKKEMIRYAYGITSITDPVFSEWLRRCYFNVK